MALDNTRDPSRELRGRRWLQQQQRSGLSVRQFCYQKQLCPKTFYTWRRRLQQSDDTPRFLPVQVGPEPTIQNAATIDIVLGGGRCLRVAPGFDPHTLRQLLHLLEDQASC
jgi:hypothetical protein